MSKDQPPIEFVAGNVKAATNQWPEYTTVSVADLKAWREEWLAENDPNDGTDCVTPFDHYLYGSQGEPVGEAGTMPGTVGFTMACFKADEVPVGTKLYAAPQPAEPSGASNLHKDSCGAQNENQAPQPAEPSRGEPKDRRDIRGIVKKLQSTYVKDGSTDEWVRLRRNVLEEAIVTLRLVSADCAHFYESYIAACARATQPAEPVTTDSAGYTLGPISDGGMDPRNEQAEPVKLPTNTQIREVFLANGFTIKPGQDDLKPYVYEAARDLLARCGS